MGFGQFWVFFWVFGTLRTASAKKWSTNHTASRLLIFHLRTLSLLADKKKVHQLQTAEQASCSAVWVTQRKFEWARKIERYNSLSCGVERKINLRKVERVASSPIRADDKRTFRVARSDNHWSSTNWNALRVSSQYESNSLLFCSQLKCWRRLRHCL